MAVTCSAMLMLRKIVKKKGIVNAIIYNLHINANHLLSACLTWIEQTVLRKKGEKQVNKTKWIRR